MDIIIEKVAGGWLVRYKSLRITVESEEMAMEMALKLATQMGYVGI